MTPWSDRRGTFYVLYEVREDLGEGAFGRVVRVRRRRDGRMFVAKIMHDRGMSDKARQEVRLPPSLRRTPAHASGLYEYCGN